MFSENVHLEPTFHTVLRNFAFPEKQNILHKTVIIILTIIKTLYIQVTDILVTMPAKNPLESIHCCYKNGWASYKKTMVQ